MSEPLKSPKYLAVEWVKNLASGWAESAKDFQVYSHCYGDDLEELADATESRLNEKGLQPEEKEVVIYAIKPVMVLKRGLNVWREDVPS